MLPHTKLFFVKALHTLIWLAMVAVIGYVLWCGLTNNVSVYSWIAVGVVMLEGLILLIFRGSCPLTVVAKRYSSSTRHNFDIFLPEWLAKHNKAIFTTIYLAGLALMLKNYFHW